MGFWFRFAISSVLLQIIFGVTVLLDGCNIYQCCKPMFYTWCKSGSTLGVTLPCTFSSAQKTCELKFEYPCISATWTFQNLSRLHLQVCVCVCVGVYVCVCVCVCVVCMRMRACRRESGCVEGVMACKCVWEGKGKRDQYVLQCF